MTLKSKFHWIFRYSSLKMNLRFWMDNVLWSDNYQMVECYWLSDLKRTEILMNPYLSIGDVYCCIWEMGTEWSVRGIILCQNKSRIAYGIYSWFLKEGDLCIRFECYSPLIMTSPRSFVFDFEKNHRLFNIESV